MMKENAKDMIKEAEKETKKEKEVVKKPEVKKAPTEVKEKKVEPVVSITPKVVESIKSEKETKKPDVPVKKAEEKKVDTKVDAKQENKDAKPAPPVQNKKDDVSKPLAKAVNDLKKAVDTHEQAKSEEKKIIDSKMTKDNKPLETKVEKLELKNPNKPDEQKNATSKTSAVMPSIPNPEKKKEIDHGIKTLKLEKVKFGPNG